MKTAYGSFFKSMGRFLPILFLCGAGAGLQAQSVNGTQQLPNRGFEEYDELNTDKVEPAGWNSFMTAKSSGGLVDMGKAKRLDRSVEKRPGSAGMYSLKAFSTEIIGVTANGNVTTGRVNMGSTNASDPSNHNFTDRESAGFNLPFTAIPDSMVVWVKYVPKNKADKGQLKAVLHGDHATKDPGTNMNEAVAVAVVNPESNNGEWIRYSVAFDKTGCGSKDPRYMLASITTNKVSGGGGAEIYVDDILFVYAPVISVGTLPSHTFNMRDGAVSFEIPFFVQGTLAMNSNSAIRNKVVAELSDAAGDFSDPVVIGSIEAEEGGLLPVVIPAGMPLGEHYRIRLRSTDRNVLSAANDKDIVLMRGYDVTAVTASVQGSVSGSGTYMEGATATVTATPFTGYHFVCWMENGRPVEGAQAAYSFTVAGDRRLEAVFAINTYKLAIVTEGNGVVRTVSGRDTFQHNERVRLEAAPDAGYVFGGYYSEGVLLSQNEVYYFNIVSDMTITAVFERGRIAINADTKQPQFGSVNGKGLYEAGSSVKLVATPMPFCDFVAWIEGKDTVSKQAEYVFTADSTRTLWAVFTQQYHTVSVRPNVMGAGVLTGGGRYSAAQTNTTIVLKAEPNTGYEFLYWKSEKDGTETEDNPFTVLEDGRLSEDLEYTAYFAVEEYTIAMEAVPAGTGTLQGAGRYQFRERVTLRATPRAGYRFVAWVRTDHGLSDTVPDNPYVFPIEEGRNRTYLALFEPIRHRVSLSAEPEGYGTVRGAGIYAHFDTAVLEAEANAGYEFRHWGIRRGLKLEVVSQENPLRVIVVENLERIAVFGERRKNVEAVCIPSHAGVVDGTGQYASGTYAILEAVPASGYRFSRWEDADGNKVFADNRLHLPVKGDTILYARFSPLRHTFTLMTEGASQAGQVSMDGGPYGSRHVQETYFGQTIRISAMPVAPGYVFTQWRMVYTQDGRLKDSLYSRHGEETYVVGGESRLVAYFVENAHRIEASVHPQASCGSVRNQGAYRHRLWMELVAEPAHGYIFSHWADKDGAVLAERSSRLPVQSLEDVSVQVFFAPDTLSVEADVRGGNANGSVRGTGRYVYGKTVTLTAEPAYGREFDGWYEASDTLQEHCLSKDPRYSFEVRKDVRLRACFVPGRFSIDVDIVPEGTGSVRGAGSYAYLSEAMLQAVPAGGYALKYFLLEEAGGKYDTLREPWAGFRMYRNKHIIACFEPTPYLLQVFSSNTAQGTVVSSQASSSVGYGSQVALRAEPRADHVFRQWRDAYGRRISRTSEFTLEVRCDTVVYADFAPEPKSFRAESANALQGYVEPYGNRPVYGSTVQVKAVPVKAYEFDRWVLASDTGKVVSRSSVLTVFVTQDTSFEARFRPARREVKIGVNIRQAGDVRLKIVEAGDTVDNGRYAYMARRATAVLRAEPFENYTFSAWVRHGLRREGVTLGETPVHALEVEDDMEIEAVFAPKLYRVDVQASPAELGVVYGGGMYEYGSPVTVRAEYGGDYAFKGWKTSDGWISATPEYVFTVTGDTLLTACFDRDSVLLSVHAGLGGHASGGGVYAKGTPVVLQAEAADGYAFDSWHDEDGNVMGRQNPYMATADVPMSVHAVFYPSVLQFLTECNEGGTVLGGGSVTFGSSVMLEARPDPGYRFVCWKSEDLVLDSQQAVLPVLGVKAVENVRVAAVFEALKFLVETKVSPLGAGTVTAGGTFDYGANIAFEAKPDAGHVFKAWTLDGKEVGTDPVLRTNVTGDAGYVAVFAPRRYNVVTAVYPERGGLAYGGGSYYRGDTAHIGLYLYDSVLFGKWSDADFNLKSDRAGFSFVVSRTEILTATVDAPPVKDPVDTISGVGDDKLLVYPNPLHGDEELHVKATKGLLGIRVFSVSGKHLFYRKFSGNDEREARLRLPQMRAGCYFYEVKFTDGSRKLGKLIRL